MKLKDMPPANIKIGRRVMSFNRLKRGSIHRVTDVSDPDGAWVEILWDDFERSFQRSFDLDLEVLD